MKRILSILALSVSLVLTASVKNTASAQVGVGVQITYQDFYDELSPHGRWMDYPDYGYVWMPNVGADFRPYGTNGRWVWSDDYEWMWASDYSWGWAPFHYGRWFMDPIYGWMWVPGYDWSPAWVAWRDGGDYYGWAPIQPGFSFGINFNIGSYNPPVDYWCFTPRRYISSPRIYNHFMPSRQNVTIINNTTIINNYNSRRTTNNIFVNGPRRGDAERYAGRINPVRFREVNTPGRTRVRNNEVSFYRPTIRRDNDRNIAPRNFDRYNNSNGQNQGNGRNGNNGTGWRQTNERNNNNNNNNGGTGWSQANERRRDNNNANERVNTSPDRNNEDRNTGWRQMNDRRNNNDANNSNNNNNRERPATTPERNNDNRNTGWRQMNDRRNNDANNSNNNNGNPERRDIFNRQRQSSVERPSAPVERNDRNRQQVDRQPDRRTFERRDNSNNEQRRMNVERPARQSMPQMNREQQRPQPQRQMEVRQGGGDRRGGGNEGQRGGGRRRD